MPIAKAKDFQEYKENYNFSINDPESFWRGEAERLSWFKFPK